MAEAKAPPHSLDVEQSILGSCLLDENACYYAIDKLNRDDFYHGSHATIFDTVGQLVAEGNPVDMVSVTQRLASKNFLDNIGGASYVAGLAEATPTSAHIDHYCDTVKSKAIIRRLMAIGRKITSYGYKVQDPGKFIAWAQHELLDIMQDNTEGMQSFREVAVDGALEQMINGEQREGTIPTPWDDLNDFVVGLSPKQLIVIAGRPSMGKTSLCEQLVIHAAKNYGPVVSFIPDMSKEEFVQRCICREARLSGHIMQGGGLGTEDMSLLTKTANQLSKLPIDLDDRILTPTQIEAQARRIKAQKGLSMVTVDYIQMLEEKAENRTQEISKISRALKGLAKRLDVPVVVLSQLSRDVEKRNNKRPHMSDLRESGQVEQDADKILFLYRDEAYSPDSDKKGIAEVKVAKQKNGPTGMVELAFIKEFMKFSDLARR